MLTFDKEDFHLGDDRTGEGCLIWANAPRVSFFIGRTIFEIVGHRSAFADEVLLARCREQRPRIEAACRRAFERQPGVDRIELQARDFQ